MRILFSWLQDFVEIPEEPEKLAEALTMAGMAVDAVNHEDGEVVFEMDITANRPDAMNHFGIAREVASIYGRRLKAPTAEIQESETDAASRASIEILDPDLCPRYSARVILGVEVKPSPAWASRRLELCGIRSVNNIADLTNYVLLEMGHPTHAFDLDLLEGSKIVVRRAREGETLSTLDGIDRALRLDHLVIADARRPVALAGVMGGLETEISDSTRDVLLESAWFDPKSIRRTSRYFGMHTEASHRFERGADPEATVWAANRIAGLLPQLSPGTILRGVLDAYPNVQQGPTIELRRSSLQRLLGVEIPDGEVYQILESLGFEVDVGVHGWQLKPPSYRLDIRREIDAVEEVARVHGYDQLPLRLPESGSAPKSAAFAPEEAELRRIARSLGYDETISYVFLSAEEAERFGSWQPVSLKNPLTEQQGVMRNSGVPSILRALEWNLHRNEPNVRLMEIGRLYRRTDGSYEEPGMMTLGTTGMARFPMLGDGGKPFEFYDLKADVSALLAPFDVVQPVFDSRDVPSYYLRGNAARVVSEGNLLAYLGELDPKVVAGRKIRQPVFLAEIFLDPLAQVSLRRLQFRPLPRVPAVQRDFSLFVPEGISFGEIRFAVGQMPHLVAVEPKEVFRGEQVPEGCYSLLMRTAWQKSTESLTDDEVNDFARQVVERLSKKLGIKQRT